MNRKKRLGNKGEAIAAAFLKKRGFRILSAQFRSRFGEIDLIASDRNNLVFIEVKTRTGEEYGTGLEAITPWKIKKIIKTGQYFKLRHPRTPALQRIDAVIVETDEQGNPLKIKHVKNIGFI